MATREEQVVARLEAWFCEAGRSFPWREDTLLPWQVLVTEMLLQQTGAERVAEFIPGFFERYDSLEALTGAEAAELAAALAPLGLQNRRAARIQELAHALTERGGDIPSNRDELLGLPGVGPYVAAAYLSVGHGEAIACVDVNLARIIERIYGPRTLVDIRYDPHINGIAEKLVKAADDPRRFNWAALDLGALVCKSRKPLCEVCPVVEGCLVGG